MTARGRQGSVLCALLATVLVLMSVGNGVATGSEDADAARSGAQPLGEISGWPKARFFENTLGGAGDVVDYSRFSLSQPMLVGVGLQRLDYDANLFLEDASCTVLGSGQVAGTANEWVQVGLVAGEYYVRVVAVEAGENAYLLRVGAVDLPPGTVLLGGSGVQKEPAVVEQPEVVQRTVREPEKHLESLTQSVDPDSTREGAVGLGNVTGRSLLKTVDGNVS